MGLELEYTDGQTHIDPDEKEGLRISGISTHGDLDEFEQLNIEKAVEWTIKRKLNVQTIFTEKFVKDVHKKMFGDVWRWAGKFRSTGKNIGDDWTLISTGLRTLLEDTLYWIENDTYSPDEIAIRFKHRLVSIHCFSNGNGRHSRLMADIIIESVFGGEVFSWNHSNMIKPNETRKKYIDALKQADMGNIQPLIEFART